MSKDKTKKHGKHAKTGTIDELIDKIEKNREQKQAAMAEDMINENESASIDESAGEERCDCGECLHDASTEWNDVKNVVDGADSDGFYLAFIDAQDPVLAECALDGSCVVRLVDDKQFPFFDAVYNGATIKYIDCDIVQEMYREGRINFANEHSEDIFESVLASASERQEWIEDKADKIKKVGAVTAGVAAIGGAVFAITRIFHRK